MIEERIESGRKNIEWVRKSTVSEESRIDFSEPFSDYNIYFNIVQRRFSDQKVWEPYFYWENRGRR